jgi:hypothetical protein
VTSIDREQFEVIGRKHGEYASWAVWSPVRRTPKSNIGDLSIFDVAAHPETLEALKADVIMVGLNISRSFAERFRNFHDPRPVANDFKIRHAFSGTSYYGAYMTDIIKNVEMVRSDDLLRHLRDRPSIVRDSLAMFRDELADLRARRPTILAFGSAVEKLILRHLSAGEYSRVVRLMHYSHRIDKEKYRDAVLSQLGVTDRARDDCSSGSQI